MFGHQCCWGCDEQCIKVPQHQCCCYNHIPSDYNRYEYTKTFSLKSCAVRPEPPDNTVVIVVSVVFGVMVIAGTVIGVVICKKRSSRKTPEEVLDERPYTTLQRGASVPHEYGVIRNDTTQGTCTSPSKDGEIYEDCLTN